MTDFPDLKLKMLVSFPAAVFGGTGLAVRQEDGKFYFDLDFSTLAPVASVPVGSEPTTFVALWDQVQDSYRRMSMTDLRSEMVVGGSEPVPIVPILSSSIGGSTIGNGLLTGTVLRLGQSTILATINFRFGTTTSFGTGYVFFTLPAPYNVASTAAGTAVVLYQHGGNIVGSCIALVGTTQLIMFIGNATISGTLPHVWASPDIIQFNIILNGP